MSVSLGMEGSVRIITIERPEAANAINSTTARELDEALRAAEADPAVRAVILTGAGSRSFCSGADLKEFADRGPAIAVRDIVSKDGFCGLTRRFYGKLIIAAVNGAAVAGGWELAHACDLIVASDTAFFQANEVARGMLADAGGCLRLPRMIPLLVAREYLLTGDRMDAMTAHRLGAVNRVVPADRLMSESVALANRILENGPIALDMTRKLMFEAGNIHGPEMWRINDYYADASVSTRDAQEGSSAYADKRNAAWHGK